MFGLGRNIFCTMLSHMIRTILYFEQGLSLVCRSIHEDHASNNTHDQHWWDEHDQDFQELPWLSSSQDFWTVGTVVPVV